jgi:hypothetical protein
MDDRLESHANSRNHCESQPLKSRTSIINKKFKNRAIARWRGLQVFSESHRPRLTLTEGKERFHARSVSEL